MSRRRSTNQSRSAGRRSNAGSQQRPGIGADRRVKKPLLLLVGLIFAVLVGSPFILTKEKIDQDFCASDAKQQNITVVLIDASDQLSKEQTAALNSELMNLTQPRIGNKQFLLEKGDRLAVYLLGEDQSDLNRIFNMCNPGALDDRTFTERATEGKTFAEMRWYEFNKKIMSEVSNRINTANSNKTSPLIETIKHIRSVEYPPSDVAKNSSIFRMIIASDFLQNSGTASHYGKLPDVREVFQRHPVDLMGMDIYIWRLNSNSHPHLQSPHHLSWWRKYFALSDANLQLPKQF